MNTDGTQPADQLSGIEVNMPVLEIRLLKIERQVQATLRIVTITAFVCILSAAIVNLTTRPGMPA